MTAMVLSNPAVLLLYSCCTPAVLLLTVLLLYCTPAVQSELLLLLLPLKFIRQSGFAARGSKSVLQVVGKGLSALTEAQLALPLDKTLQCSSWGSRPFTQAQVTMTNTLLCYG